MSLFARAAPAQTRAITNVPWDLPTGNDSGEPVTEHSAMHLSAVWACVGLIADIISTLPVRVYRGTGAAREEVTGLPLALRRPSGRLDRRDWLAQGVTSLLLHGNTYGLITALDGAARPATVEWLPPHCVSVEDEDGSCLTRPVYRVDGRVTPREMLVHIPDQTMPGSVKGLSPIRYQAQTIGVGLASQKFGAAWFGQGAHPSAILSTDQKLDAGGAQAMKDRFMASIRGRREPAALGMGIKYTAVQVNPEESQFLETVQANAADIARVFRVPPEMIGAAVSGSSVTYANREQRWQDFLNLAILPRVVRFEDVLTSMIPEPDYVKFDLDELLRADLRTRYESHAKGITAGFLSVNEARRVEDLPPRAELPEPEPEVSAALALAARAPSLVQNPGLPALVDQLRTLNGKPPLNPQPIEPPTGGTDAS